MKHKRTDRFWRTAAECLLASIGLGVLTFAAFRLHASPYASSSMAILFFFFFIVLISQWVSFFTSVVVSILAVLSFNYFFAKPLFSLRVSETVDIVAVVTFSIYALVITRLRSQVKARTAELQDTSVQLQAETAERRRAEKADSKTQAELAPVTRVLTIVETARPIAHIGDQPLLRD